MVSSLLLFLCVGVISASGGMAIPTCGSVSQLFLKPIDYEPAGQYYDQNNQLQSVSYQFHHGTDIADGCYGGRYPIYAAADGTVAFAGYLGDGYGHQIIVDHGYDVGGNGKYTYSFYSHMGDKDSGESYIWVSADQEVSAGDLIGYQGNSGYSFGGCPPDYGTHLDWEIRLSSTPLEYSTSMRYSAIAASPDFYTGVQLTQGDPSPATYVNAGPFTFEGKLVTDPKCSYYSYCMQGWPLVDCDGSCCTPPIDGDLGPYGGKYIRVTGKWVHGVEMGCYVISPTNIETILDPCTALCGQYRITTDCWGYTLPFFVQSGSGRVYYNYCCDWLFRDGAYYLIPEGNYSTWETEFPYCTNEFGYVHHVLRAVAATEVPSCHPGDFNLNACVDLSDMANIASRWRCRDGDDCYSVVYDLDGDGIITVVDIMKTVVQWEGAPPMEGVTLYEHPNYMGRSEIFTGDDLDLNDNWIGNDTVSSLRVTEGYGVTLYEHTYYMGSSETFTANDPRLDDNLIGDDIVSSLQVWREP